METYSAKYLSNKIYSYQSQQNAETQLFTNANNVSNNITEKKNNDAEDNINEIKSKKIFIPNLNLNGLLDKSNYSNLYGSEANQIDFLGKKREIGNPSRLNFNEVCNRKESNEVEFANAKNENLNVIDIFGNQAANKNSNFSDNENTRNNNNNNKRIKINSAIKKIGAKIIKASPSESPKFKKKINFSQEKKIIFEMKESENSQRSNESKLTEALEAQNNYKNNSHNTDENEAEVNININNTLNLEGDDNLNKLESVESNQIHLDLHENDQDKENFPEKDKESCSKSYEDIEITLDLPAKEIILDFNPNNFTFKNPAKYGLTEIRQRHIPYSEQNNFKFTENTNKNPYPIFESNIAYNENPLTEQPTDQGKQSDGKLFSNQNLYFTNLNQMTHLTEDFNFERPYNVNNKLNSNYQLKNNHIKFSNTEIPEVFDEGYIQRRINKAEIHLPNAEYREDFNIEVNFNANQTQSFNPIQQINGINGMKNSSNNIFNQSLIPDKNRKWPDFSSADFQKFLGPLALIGLGYFLYTFHKEEIRSFMAPYFTKLNDLILINYSRELIILIVSIAIVSTLIYYVKKYYDEQQKIINDSAKEMQDYILSILEFTNEEGLRYPDIDVEDFSAHYAKEKNISEPLMKKILKKLDAVLEDKNSEIVKISLYLDGKMKSFWKLKIDCI